MTTELRDKIWMVVSDATDAQVGEGWFDLLCSACAQAVASRLKPDVSPESDCPDAFALAVGWMIAEQWEIQSAGTQVTSFTAGSVTITGSGSQAAKQARCAQELLRPWLQDSAFAFLGVMG